MEFPEMRELRAKAGGDRLRFERHLQIIEKETSEHG